MKKFAAIVLSLMLCLGAVAGLAEAPVVNWADVEGSVADAGLEGQFVELTNTGLMMWLPSAFQAVEVPEEMAALGVQCAFATADNSGQVAVSLYQMAEGSGLAEYAAALETSGVTEIEYAVLNGLDAFSAKMVDANGIESTLVCIAPAAGYVAQLTFGPMGDEGFEATAQMMTASVQPLAQ